MENEIAENINIADLSFVGDEDVIVTAGNIDIVYMDASRLTPQQIKDLEILGKKYPGHVIQAGSLDTLLNNLYNAAN